MKRNKLFTYLLTPLTVVTLIACLGRGHNLRKISSVSITNDQQELVDSDDTPKLFIEGKKTVVIGNFFDILNKTSKDDSQGFYQEGNWFQDKLRGSGNSISRFTKDPSARAIYTTDELGDSTYCIWVYRVTSNDASKELIFDIYDGSEQIGLGPISLALNKKAKGWYPLGEFTFTSGQESRVILSKDSEDKGVFRADEVRFSRLEYDHDCQGRTYSVLDNEQLITASELDPVTFKREGGYREYGEWSKSKLTGVNGNNIRISADDYAYSSFNFMPKQQSYCLEIFRVTSKQALSNVKVSVFQDDIEISSSLVNYHSSSGKSGRYSLGRHNVERDKVISVIFEREPLDIGVLVSDAVRFYSSNSCN